MTARFFVYGRMQSLPDVVARFHAAGFLVDKIHSLPKKKEEASNRALSAPDLVARFHAAGFSVDKIHVLPEENGEPSGRERCWLLSASYSARIESPFFSVRKARVMRRLSKRMRGLNLEIDLLDGPSDSEKTSDLEKDLLQTSPHKSCTSEEVVLRQLSQKSARSKVCLVRSPDGRLLVRKTFYPGFRRNLEREIKARKSIADPRLSPILSACGMTLSMPWYGEYTSFAKGLFEFYPVRAARNVISFLEGLSAKGLAMVDINPASFLYDNEGRIMVVDCEYWSEAPAEMDFSQCLDFKGTAADNGLDSASSTGWNYFWRDATGLPYKVLRFGGPAAITCWRAAHIVFRVVMLAIRPLLRFREALLASLFYWSRRCWWGIQIHGKSERVQAALSRPTQHLICRKGVLGHRRRVRF